jgi:hypothetical protein
MTFLSPENNLIIEQKVYAALALQHIFFKKIYQSLPG